MNLPENTSKGALIRISSTGVIEGANSLVEEITGFTAADLIGRQAADIFKRTDVVDLPDNFASLGNESIIQDLPLQIDSRQGDHRSLLLSVFPLPGIDSKYAGALICLRDAGAEAPIWSRILDSIADGVFSVDRNWKITSFNRAAESITGWQAEDVLGKSCSDLFQASICGRSCAIAESLYSGTPVCNRSITIRTRSGEIIPISISASPLADTDGNFIGGVETFRDLSTLNIMYQDWSPKQSFDEIISRSKVMQKLFGIMPEVAASPSTVLIIGESGTGKELMAKSIYNMSTRNNAPFIALNCGALPESLLESELFGYKAGAFTDARKDKEGRFAAAEGGTLFLDEIGDIPQSIQVKLLRVLQEKVYEPLGSNIPVKTDVRIITATNRNLQKLVREGNFREDLYYRLNVARIHLPALRERKEDIPPLIEQFIKEFSAQQGKEIVGISRPALNILMRYNFPGNIRELKNIIEYAFILCEGGYILSQHLPEPFGAVTAAEEDEGFIIRDAPRTLEEIERQAIYLALEKNGWKKNVTCEELGISKDTLRRKLARYNLEPSGLDEPDSGS